MKCPYPPHVFNLLVLVLCMGIYTNTRFAPGLQETAFVRDSEINNSQRLRRILVRIQGASRGRISGYVTLDATQKTSRKTSKNG
jgi:hypothetical protein